MGNTLPAIAYTAKHTVQYTLFATDDNAEWRYPHQSFSEARHELATDVDTALQVMEVRINLIREQIPKIHNHLDEIMWRLGAILFRIWRIAYHVIQMLDEVGAVVVEMCIMVPRVLLELGERAREWRRM